MALDLTMKITADASQAKAELRSVEQGIQKVEQAAAKTEQPIARVAQALGGQSIQTEGLIRSTAKLEQTTQNLSAATSEQIYQQVRASLGIAEMEQRCDALSGELQAVSASAKGFTTALVAGGVAIAAFLAVGALELKFLYDSAKLYAEKTGMMEEFNGAVDRVKESWQNMQYAVGAVLLSNVHDVTSWANIAIGAIDLVGGQIVHMVAQSMAAFNMLGAGWRSVVSFVPGMGMTAPGAPGTPSLFSPSPVGMPAAPDFRAVEAELTARRVTLDAQARAQAGYDRQRAGAAEAVAAFQSSYRQSGIYGALPGVGLGMPVAPGSVPSLAYRQSGLYGSLPGAALGLPQGPGTTSAYGSTYGGSRYANPLTRDYFGFGDQSGVTGALGRGVNMLQGAYNMGMGALGVWQSTSQGSTASRTAHGAMQGLQAGAMFGPWGAAIGAGAGALIGLVKGIAAGSQQHQDMIAANKQIDQLKSGLLADYGSAANIKALGGGDLNAGWGGQNVAGLKAFSGEVEAFRAKATGAMNDMVHAALTAGQAIPAGMQPILESLIKQGQLTEANANLLMGLPEKGVPAFADIQAAAEDLGVSIESLGSKVQNIKLSEQAEAAAHSFEVLRDAGADMGAVFQQSAPKMQHFVDDALKMGLSLPESIKPWLQQMVDAGLLVDQTGAKLTDLSQFKFTEPLEQSVEKLITKLDELIQTLGGAKSAIGDIDGSTIDVNVNRHYKDDGQNNYPNGDPDFAARGGYVGPWGVQYLKRGGWIARGTDTVPAMLTPGEGVLSRRGMDALGKLNRGEGVGGLHVHVNFTEPVFTDDYTSLSKFSDKVARAIEHGYTSRGYRLPAN